MVKKIIDLRSDTVTLPTQEMKEAMLESVLGDDVYEDDPTVKQLEQLAASILGKEAALFVPTGTFGNQLALLTHTNRGDEVIVEANCHIKKYEVGASSVISSVFLHTIEGHLGKMDLNKIKKAIRTEDIHFPNTTLICLENATGFGTVLDLNYMKDIHAIAKTHNLNIHLDGARIFNAATALNVDVKDIAQYADSIMFCLSKGLASPVGSILAGSCDFIKKARKNRKLMGGGMRQVGILAACGLVSLEKMRHRLIDDHENAKYLAKELKKLGFKVIENQLDLNMVFVENDGLPQGLEKQLLNYNIKINGYLDSEMRLVTHHDVSREDIDYFINTLKMILE